MKLLIGLAIACLLVNAGCSSSVSYEEALTKNKDRFEDPSALEDAKFLVESKSRNMFTIQVLKLASESGYSSVVVNFAKQTLPEHEKLDEEIVDLAKDIDVTLPDELSKEHQTLLSELTSVPKENFDNTFSRIIGSVNEENNSFFTTKATRASDPDVRAFAARKLDLLREHSQLLSTMQSQLLNTTD